MSGIFKKVTHQAIKEMVEEHAIEGKFGLLLDETALDKLCHQISDFFIMSLDVRTKAQNFAVASEEEEIYQPIEKNRDYAPQVTLPRQKVAMSQDELKRLGRF